MSRVPIVAIPHRMRASVWHVLPESIANCESDAKDEFGDRLDDEGLHDLNAWVRLEDAATYRGHQQETVRRLACQTIKSL